MKKIIIAVGLLCPVLLFAQNFEGIIKFSMEYKGEQAAMLVSTMPSSNIVTLKGSNSKVVLEGGILSGMVGDVINKGDEKTTYFVQSAKKTVYKVKSDDLKTDKESDVTVTKESSTATILGYKCQKYKVVTKNGIHYVWATKEINMGSADFRGKISYKGIEGVIMKQEMNVTEQGATYTIIITMVAIDQKSKIGRAHV